MYNQNILNIYKLVEFFHFTSSERYRNKWINLRPLNKSVLVDNRQSKATLNSSRAGECYFYNKAEHKILIMLYLVQSTVKKIILK